MDNIAKAKESYDLNLTRQPCYTCGKKRPSWDDLDRLAKIHWIRRTRNDKAG